MNFKKQYLNLILISLAYNQAYACATIVSAAKEDLDQSTLNKRLVCAVYSGNSDSVEHLLGLGADANAANHTTDKAVLKSLNLNKRITARTGGTVLHVAAALKFEKIVQLLLDSGSLAINVNNQCETPLIVAAMAGYYDIVEMLLKSRPTKKRSLGSQFVSNVNEVDNLKNTALHHSAKGSNARVIQLLLDSGASKYVLNSKNMTPFEEAISSVNGDDGLENIEVLLHAGIDPNAKFNKNEKVPIATLFEDFEKNNCLIHLLLSYNTKIDFIKNVPDLKLALKKYYYIPDDCEIILTTILDEDYYGDFSLKAITYKSKFKMNVLHWAAARGNFSIFEKIVNFVCSNYGKKVLKDILLKKNAANMTPLDIAIRNREIMKIREMNISNIRSFDWLKDIAIVIESYLSGDHLSIIELIKNLLDENN